MAHHAGIIPGHVPKVKLEPGENVYSYFIFAVPMEDQKKDGGSKANKLLALVLVLLSTILQAVVLYAIFNSVVAGDVKWRNSILNPQGERFVGSNMNPLASAPAKCNSGGSLCIKRNGTYTCAPPSVQLTGRWDELDVNGDGIWTRAEAEAKRDELQCEYAVNVIEVFDVFVKFLLNREGVIWIHPDLRAGQAIHEPYFTYAAGDIIMCHYRNVDACPNLLARGVFDAPLRYGTAPRVGDTIDSALAYCYKLLEEGGVCQRTLPSTYSVWTKSSKEQCRDADYDKYVYVHPITGKTKSMLTVDYDAVKDYTRAGQSNIFLIYKTIIVTIYLLVMLGELREICFIAQWIVGYPSVEGWALEHAQEEAEEGKNQEAEESSVVQGVSRQHRVMVSLFVLARFVMLIILTWVGMLFLLKDTDYINLLLNSLGLIVVVEIIQNVYVYLISPELREACESMEPMEVPALGPACLNRRPAVRDLLLITVFMIGVVGAMAANHIFIVDPLTNSLECACLSQGEQCFEAQKYNFQFWKQYWTEDVPSVFKDLDELKVEAEEESSLIQAAAPSASKTLSAADASVAVPSAPVKRRRRAQAHQAGDLSIA